MPGRYIPVGRIAALLALGVGIWVLLRGITPPHWKTLAPGVEFALVRGEPYCRRGPADVALLRVDPARADFRVFHYTRTGEKRPPNVLEWQRRLDALAVFNAGQYYPDFSYMGLLVSAGAVVSERVHPGFHAALVAAPARGQPTARVLDLEHEPLDGMVGQWREIAQSFMLFDERGQLRVRKSDQVANRTVVAQDRRGRLVVATTEGGYTLWDFAELLRRAPLGLTHAMSMDGGHEAELCIVSGRFRYWSLGHWSGTPDPDAAVPLPAVVAVMKR
jgi:uncharacterized protein YigE (DUF2233 family)